MWNRSHSPGKIRTIKKQDNKKCFEILGCTKKRLIRTVKITKKKCPTNYFIIPWKIAKY
jgi:hypothetical protein